MSHKTNDHDRVDSSRRTFMKGAAAAAIALPFIHVPKAMATEPVTFASFGGFYNQAIKNTIIKAFTEKTGIPVRMASNTSLANLKGQIKANAVQWDICELTGTEYEIARTQNVALEPINFDIVNKANIPSYAVRKHGIKYAFFLEVMAWNKKYIKTPPNTWAEFFDPKKLPVRRSLYTRLSDSMLLEFALISDGVPLTGLYPLDVERALKALSHLDKSKIIWYQTNQQVIEQMVSGSSYLGMPFTGRVIIANKSGADLGYAVNQGGATGDYLVVPQASKNKENAMKLINFICSDPESVAAFMRNTRYGVSNLPAIAALDPKVAAEVPTSPQIQNKIFRKNDAWWSKNLDMATQKFKAWQVS